MRILPGRFSPILPGLCLLLLLFPASPCGAQDGSPAMRELGLVASDFRNFYLDRESLLLLGAGIAGAGALANTNADSYLRDTYQEDLRSDGTDRAAKIFRVPGEGLVAVPLYAVVYGAGRHLENPVLEEWARRSFRATLVGAPAVFFLEYAIGSGRPEEGGSGWKPFDGHQGVSGHAFLGGVPFLTAARMAENPYLKGALYGLSVLPGLSRVNDDQHYLSQAALGWILAWSGCRAVAKTETGREGKADVAIVPVGDGVAIAFSLAF